MSWNPTMCWLLMGVLLFCTGCGGGAATEGRVKVYPVSGKVSMSGGPLAGANVAFAPHEGQPVAIGKTNAQGEFTLTTYEAADGAAAGRYSVVIKKVATAATGDAAPDAGHSPDGRNWSGGGHDAKASADDGSLVPPQYGDSKTTPLQETVAPDGENQFNFEL